MDMNQQSLGDLVKRDKKLGRARKPQNNQQRNPNAPLPGRGRGGANNVQRAQNVPKTNQNNNRIQKQKQKAPQQQAGAQRQQAQNPTQNLTRQQMRNQRRRQMRKAQPLMGAQNQAVQPVAAQPMNRRQRLQALRQNKKPVRGRRVPNAVQNQPRAQQQPQVKRGGQNAMPRQMPRQTATPQPQNLQKTLSVVQGTLAERKVKVRGIDARVVSLQDLQKLFGKCGPLINASFDTNEYGGYLGSATVIFSRASSATRAIKEYHLAKIDNKPMRVTYAQAAPAVPAQPVAQAQVPAKKRPQKAQAPAAKAMPGRRPAANRIGKTGQGRTLNVMGQRGRQQRRANRQ